MAEKPIDKPIDKRLQVVALQYRAEQRSPFVSAKGQGELAARILETAKGAGVAVHKDEALIEELNRLDVGDHIPPELYEVVARILVFIADVDRLAEMREDQTWRGQRR